MTKSTMWHGRHTKVTAVDRVGGLLYGLMMVAGLIFAIVGLTWFFTAFPWADVNETLNYFAVSAFAGGAACYIGHELYANLALDKAARDTWTKRVPWDPAAVHGTATRVGEVEQTPDGVPQNAIFGHHYDHLVIDEAGNASWTEE